MYLELTLALIKPHVVKVPSAVEKIRQVILENGFYIIRSKQLRISRDQIENFYKEHAGKFFYNRLTTFMMSGPSEAYILAHPSAIDEWRRLMGPTKVYRAIYSDPNTLRANFGLSDTRNAAHGSDSMVSALREISILYPEFKAPNWLKTEEIIYRKGNVRFDEVEFVHVPLEEKCNL